MGRSTFDKLRVWAIHKLKGITPDEVRLPETPPIKAYTVVPKKVTAKMILHEGREYAPAVVQQRLSYQLADVLVDNGFINFYTGVYQDGLGCAEIRADLWVVKKEE